MMTDIHIIIILILF